MSQLSSYWIKKLLKPPRTRTYINRLTDIALCKVTQDSLGFSIPRCGFRIPGTGFQSLSVELGLWIPSCGFLIPGTGSGQERIGSWTGFFVSRIWIPDSFQSIAGFRILQPNSRFQSPRFRIPLENNFTHSAIRITLHGATNTLVNRGSLLFNFSINNSVNEKSKERKSSKKAGNKGMDTEVILTHKWPLRYFNFRFQ